MSIDNKTKQINWADTSQWKQKGDQPSKYKS